MKTKRASIGDTPKRVLDIMESVSSPALRIAWDEANFVQVGVRPYTEGYAKLRPYLAYLQVKDALATTGEVVPSGEGDGELEATIGALKADGYAGFASLEPHPTWPAPTSWAASRARRPSAPRPALSPRWPRKTRSHSSDRNATTPKEATTKETGSSGCQRRQSSAAATCRSFTLTHLQGWTTPNWWRSVTRIRRAAPRRRKPTGFPASRTTASMLEAGRAGRRAHHHTASRTCGHRHRMPAPRRPCSAGKAPRAHPG